MQFRQRSHAQSPAVLEIRRGFERTVGAGVVVECNGGGIVRIPENLQIPATGVIRVVEEKSLVLRVKNNLPDFMESLADGRRQQIEKG